MFTFNMSRIVLFFKVIMVYKYIQNFLTFMKFKAVINHIQILGFLPFPYSSHARFPVNEWPMSNNITAFVLGL
jgi:hypothetical protein